MKYKLTQEDYLDLWASTSPEKIHQVFGERSFTPRHIRRLYVRYGVARGRELLKEYLREAAPETPNLSSDEKMKLIKSALQKREQEVLARIWKNIKNFEERWG
jgi:hypothetical protein